MRIYNSRESLSVYLESLPKPNTIGFVPTMGALHQGHLSLLRESMSHNDFTVISIFVNPTQFDNPEDLAKYPRTLESDINEIESIDRDVVVFAPSVDDIYHGNTTSESFNFDGLENQMEGKFRIGHFDGVGTIVKRLFEIVKPTHAYFGEKDFQQLQIVKKLVQKLGMPVKVIGCPIFRDENGLAMSSRNARLTTEQKTEAALIYKTLQTAKLGFGTKTVSEVSTEVEQAFRNNNHLKLEYFAIADEDTLEPVAIPQKDKKYRAFIAVFVNNVRLIDTIALN